MCSSVFTVDVKKPSEKHFSADSTLHLICFPESPCLAPILVHNHWPNQTFKEIHSKLKGYTAIFTVVVQFCHL